MGDGKIGLAVGLLLLLLLAWFKTSFSCWMRMRVSFSVCCLLLLLAGYCSCPFYRVLAWP